MSTVTARFNMWLQVFETGALGEDLVTERPDEHRITNALMQGVLAAGTTVPATKVWSDRRTLSGGNDTLDLTALVRANLTTHDFTGLKLQAFAIFAAVANTAAIIITPNTATNGYNLFGNTAGRVDLLGGQAVMQSGNDKLADVSSSVKEILVGSTDLDAIYEIVLVAG